MAKPSVRPSASTAPLQKVPRTESETARLQEWREIPVTALRRSGLTVKAAAYAMNKSYSWTLRAFKGLEKLGWVDVGLIDDPKFWDEVLELMAEYHTVVFGPRTEEETDAEIGRRVRQLLRVVR
jgi:hypothetical protein